MRPLRSLLLYVCAVFLLGALLAPWIYELTAWAGKSVPFFAKLSSKPFSRFVSRSLMVVALLGLWPYLRSLGIHSWREVGVVKPSGQWGRLGLGFAAGFATIACIGSLALLAGARMIQPEVGPRGLISASLSAIAGGVLEELLFRGVLFGTLRKVHSWRTALILSSVVYALLHFFQRPPPPPDVTWSSGLELLPQMLRGLAQIQTLVPGFFTLTLAGIILGWAFHRTGNLYFSIGLHAGWIFWIKSYTILTMLRPGANVWFWGTNKLIDGWSGLVGLAALLGMLVLLFRRTEKTARTSA